MVYFVVAMLALFCGFCVGVWVFVTEFAKVVEDVIFRILGK